MIRASLPERNRGPVAVTGATGHVGNVLVRELVNRGAAVRAVVLPGENLEPLGGVAVEVERADVRDRSAVGRAFRGCRQVYHLAGIVTISGGQRRVLREVNVLGTRNVVRAALEEGVSRLVYVSSVHALSEPPAGQPFCAGTVFEPDRLLGDYAWSKALASQEVLAALDHGLDAVMVFPSGIVGPYDFRLSELGTLFLDFARGNLRAFVDGAYDFVDVRDVVAGMIAAMEHGRSGEGYLLTGCRVTVRQMLEVLEQVTGIRSRARRLPMWLARAAAVLAPTWYRLRRHRPVFTSYSLKVLRSNCLMDTSKSVCELGYRVRPFRETVAATIEWFRASGRLGPAEIPRACG